MQCHTAPRSPRPTPLHRTSAHLTPRHRMTLSTHLPQYSPLTQPIPTLTPPTPLASCHAAPHQDITHPLAIDATRCTTPADRGALPAALPVRRRGRRRLRGRVLVPSLRGGQPRGGRRRPVGRRGGQHPVQLRVLSGIWWGWVTELGAKDTPPRGACARLDPCRTVVHTRRLVSQQSAPAAVKSREG